MNRDSRIQHLGEERQEQRGAVAPPIYRTSLFAFPDCASLEAWFQGKSERYLYTRTGNPTIRLLEEKTADLEGTADAIAFASGMGAISAVLLSHLRAGDHLILLAQAYSPTLAFARDILEPTGVVVTRVAASDMPSLERHLRESTRLIYVESPASLTFEVIDLEQIAGIARRRGIPTASDNSWATPLYLQPARLGIDIVVHSGTKYIGGHSDILLGLAAGSAEAMARVRRTASLLGATLSPEDAFLALRGLRTLPLRMARHQQSALLLSSRLLAHSRVKAVLHPAQCFFPSHPLWQKQFSGSSGLFSFRIDGDSCRFCDALRLFLIGVSWGGHESLALPAAVLKSADRGVDRSAELRPDLPSDLIRLSVGLEDPEDLWKDLERGFAALG
jgi:cystathionine beta-lyase